MTVPEIPHKRTPIHKINRRDDVEIHLSVLILFPGEEDERKYIDIRDYNVESEMYGHGIVIPMGLAPDLARALNRWVNKPYKGEEE